MPTQQKLGVFRVNGYTTSLRYNGNIDEVAVWDSELSAGEVTAIYNGGKPKDLSGLSPVSWWRMGEEATYDGSGSSTGLKIYLNGSRVDDTTSNVGVYSAMFNTNAPLTIGRAFQSNANGKIDEAAIFPVELGLSDIQAIYNSGIPNDISSYSPVGYWKLGEEAKFTDNWLVPNSALSNFSKYSFNFDGLDDEVSMDFTNTSTTGTISVWVKPTDYTTGSQSMCIYTSGGYRDYIMLHSQNTAGS